MIKRGEKCNIEQEQRYKRNKMDFYLQCKIKGNVNPEGYPSVYFGCHEEDFISTFESVTEEIFLFIKNATFSYTCHFKFHI